jgi:hypothetical protein
LFGNTGEQLECARRLGLGSVPAGDKRETRMSYEEVRPVTVPEDWTLSALEIWAVFPGGLTATAKARAFLSFLEQSIPRLGNG